MSAEERPPLARHDLGCACWPHVSESDALDAIAAAALAEYRDGKRVSVPTEPGAPDPINAAYRERNAVVAALIRSNGWKARLTLAPDAEGWWIVYAETPQGQVSWHVGKDDLDLFGGVPVEYVKWDGHAAEEKYARLAALASQPVPAPEPK